MKPILLLQCGKRVCGHVLTKDEQEWIPHPDFREGSKLAVCPQCGHEEFYTLNAQGQKRRMSDPHPWEIDPADVEPSPKMGLKMKRRILAAKRRAMASSSSNVAALEKWVNKARSSDEIELASALAYQARLSTTTEQRL